MPVEILFPELGEGVHEGTVSRWLKKEGDAVKEDEPVVEIMTDKVNTELGAPASGVLMKILVPEGGTVEVFHAMGLIDDGKGGAVVPSTPAAPAESKPAPVAVSSAPTIEIADSMFASAPQNDVVAEPVGNESGNGKLWVSPVVRAIAKEKNISDAQIAKIPGTGTGGRVTKKDIEGFLSGNPVMASAPVAQPAAVEKAPTPTAPQVAQLAPKEAAPATVAGPEQTLVPLVGMRKMIADHMVKSSAVPTVSTLTEIDVTNMVKFRTLNKDSFPAQFGVKLTYTPFFIKAIAETLLEFPLLNAALMPDNNIAMNKNVHMGVAVSLGKNGDEGLIVPVIKNANTKGLIEIAKELEEIAKKARSNSLGVADVQGGTFTLTNPGSYGAVLGTPMINAPQAAILGTYAIKKVPVIVDDMIAIRSMTNFVLTYDHRIVDGGVAGRFLLALKKRLELFDFFK